MVSVSVCLRMLKFYVQKKEYQGVATSRLVYTPAIEEDGRYLSCRVLAGGKIKESLEDTWEIKVLCEFLSCFTAII